MDGGGEVEVDAHGAVRDRVRRVVAVRGGVGGESVESNGGGGWILREAGETGARRLV